MKQPPAPQAAAYAELYCQSNYSFLVGASHPEELVRQAHALGYHALAITDECSLAGVVRAHVEAQRCGLNLIIGSVFVTAEGLRLVALVPHIGAYRQLSSLISQARRRSEKGRYLVRVADFEHRLRDGLFLWLPDREDESRSDSAVHDLLRYTKGRLWVGLTCSLGADDSATLSWRMALAEALGLPMVALGAVLMHEASRKPLQDTLTAIRLNTTLQGAGLTLQPNGERILQPREHLAQRFSPAALAETVAIAGRCRFSLRELRYQYPRELVPPGLSALQHLRQRVEAGVRQRWPQGILPRVRAQIEKEMQLIEELRYEYYFLTVHDIVEFARSRGILCQGRGSAANSAVCFCLMITEVDPAVHHLLFERFISRERNEPPDIDVDFEHERREEVIQFIYRKYGRQRAALTATVISYRLKSALRDVGKALGLDASVLDALTGSLSWWDKPAQLRERLQATGIDPGTRRLKQLLYLVNALIGFPRQLSQHVGGFIISDGPLDQLVPIENASMADRTVVQWDKDDIEALGLMKIDVLALGMLSAIRRCFDLLAPIRGRRWSMASLPAEDPAVYAMLQQGDSVGVFQVESRAQMAMLPRLKPARFYDLVIEVAIVRPGPIQGNMVHPYLQRRDNPGLIEYPSEAVRGVLERTLGVPIFQEQVIELAMVAAGFTAGEADQLRRAMASWRKKGELLRYQQQLAEGLRERGYTEDFAERIIEQINGFGEYGFPESHAASFALLVYVSAWLKCHEPAAFCCALLNSQPMGFYAPAQLVQDARRHGVEVLPVDVCHSQWDHSLEPRPQASQPALRLGLRLLKHLSDTTARKIIAARQQGLFRNLSDFTRRCGLTSGELDSLAHGNALHALAGNRFQARWDILAHQMHGDIVGHHDAPEDDVTLPAPTEADNTLEDYDSLGLTLGRHPLAQLRKHPRLRHCKTHREILELGHKRFVQTAGIVTCRQRPGTATGVVFLTLEDETGQSNIVVWRDLVEKFRREVVHGHLLKIKGVVEKQGRVTHVIAGHIEDVSDLVSELPSQSRDFH
jgi:error-prone DNA polymerase